MKKYRCRCGYKAAQWNGSSKKQASDFCLKIGATMTRWNRNDKSFNIGVDRPFADNYVELLSWIVLDELTGDHLVFIDRAFLAFFQEST